MTSNIQEDIKKLKFLLDKIDDKIKDFENNRYSHLYSIEIKQMKEIAENYRKELDDLTE